MSIENFYTVVNSKDQFVYFDLGYIEFDTKMPRRSGKVGTMDDANKLLLKAKLKLKERAADNSHNASGKELAKMKLRIIHVTYSEVK